MPSIQATGTWGSSYAFELRRAFQAEASSTAVLRGHEGGVLKAAFSPDGPRIVTASFDHTARIWDAPTTTETAVLRGHENFVSGAAFSADGARVVTASADGTARIWDAATGVEITVLRGPERGIYDAVFSPGMTQC